VITEQKFNLARSFHTIATEYPAFPAIVSERTQITYLHLLSLAVAFARNMQRCGVDQKSLVALNTGDAVVSLSALLATSLLGCRFVVAGKVLAHQKVVSPTHFFKSREAVGKAGVPFIEIDESWMPQDACDLQSALEGFEGYGDAEDPWMLLHTSGTTGNPKMLALSHAAVFKRTMAVSEDFPLARTTVASLFGNTARPFYARALAALSNAGTIVDSYDTAFWKRAGVNLVVGSPRQLEKFFGERSVQSRIARLEISGAKLTDDFAVALSKSFDRITDVYGASETSKSFSNNITFATDGAVTRTGKVLDSTIEILDTQGNNCEPGTAGTVRVKNDYMTAGYMNSPEATANSFVDGWFYPGDTATWGPRGELQITGRNDDVLSFGGLKLDAALVDLILKVTPGVKDAVCFKNPKEGANNEILAFVVFEGATNRALCVSEMRAGYQTKLGLPCFLGNIHAVDEVPYNDEGKPMRAFCQEMVLERVKELRAVYAP
jgi:acyl-coenzyme A synthetase/AMP-(fatty) acid ligase